MNSRRNHPLQELFSLFRSKEPASPPKVTRLPRVTAQRKQKSEPPTVTAAPHSLDAFSEAALESAAKTLLESLGFEALAKQVTVRWNPRLRTTAGLACYRKMSVSLNPRLIPFGMDEVNRTLLHEVAHLLARFRTGRRRIQPHGVEWKQACIDLGLTDEKRCHELPLPRRRVARKLLYRCRNCGQEVPRVRPFKRAVACIKCCRTYNNGRYNDRFKFVKVADEEWKAA